MKGGLRLNNILKDSHSDKPLVSIITVVLNGEKHLEQAMTSVFIQTYSNIEYIIIDGGSTDSSCAIIKNYENKIDYWQSEKDEGLFFAMNKGISLAKGEIIGILNCDDYYKSNAIEKVVSVFIHANSGIVYGNMIVLTNEQEGKALTPDISLINEKPAIFHPSCFVKKEVYNSVGLFDTRFKISSDYEFLLRCIRSKVKFEYLNEPLTCFRAGGMSGKCASNIEGYKIMKIHQTGFHNQVIWRGIKCYIKQFIKKVLNLK